MNDLHFAQIREDSWVEREVANSERPQRIAVIASGGCTALSLLDDSVDEVLAIDASPAQCALVELRKAAIRRLDLQGYLAFVGEEECSRRLQTWALIAPELPSYAKEYWEARLDAIRTGVQQSGTTERFYRFVSSHLRTLLGGEVLHALLNAPSIEAQRALFARHFERDVTQAVLRVLLAKSTHLLFFPAFMFDKAQEHDFAAFFAKQFEREVCARPLRGNYFLSQLFFGRYLVDDPRGVPPYLTEVGYAAAKRNLHKLRLSGAPLHAALERERGVDAFFVSNVFDWCNSELMESTCASMLSSARPGATLLYRNMLSESALPSCLTQRFTRDETRSRLLHEQDRSILYRGLSIGTIR